MKILYPNKIVSAQVTAGTEDPAYPVGYMLNDAPGTPGKLTTTSGTLMFTVGGGASALFLYEVNFYSIDSVVVRDYGGTAVVNDSLALGEIVDTYWEFTHGVGERKTSLWVEYPVQTLLHTIEISVSASAPIRIGVVTAGPVMTFPTIRSVKEGPVEFAVKEKLENGDDWTKILAMKKAFQCKVRLEREPGFYQFMYDMAAKMGTAGRFACQLTDLGERWELFGRFDGMPQGGHIDRKSMITLRLIEA